MNAESAHGNLWIASEGGSDGPMHSIVVRTPDGGETFLQADSCLIVLRQRGRFQLFSTSMSSAEAACMTEYVRTVFAERASEGRTAANAETP